MVESSNDAINGATLDGIITSWNIGAELMYGYTAAEATGRSVSMLTPPDAAGADVALRDRLRTGEPVIAQEVPAVRKDGTIFDVALTFSPVYDAGGTMIGSCAIARDITEVRRLRAAAELDRDRLIAAQEMAHVGSAEINMVTGHRWWSDEYFRINGLPLDTVPTEELWLSLIHPQDRQRVEQHWRQLESGGPPVEVIHRIIRPDGELRWVHLRATAEHDADNKVLKLVETGVDITDRKVAEEALERLAYQDPLTGLANRARLTERIDEALGEVERYGGQVAVLFLDVDRFKLINDAMGHAAGDSLLVQLADRLRGTVRPGDVLARFAGDEFVIVCCDISEEGAQQLGKRIQRSMQAPFTLLGREVFANVSVGISLSRVGDAAESLLHNADAAMYRSKEGLLSAPVVFDEAMHQRAQMRLNVESLLPRAIERNELRVFYQPILDVQSMRPVGFEALVRWQHPEYGLILPNDFIPVAEETGLIVPIGAWVLAEAIQQAQHWRSNIPGAQDWRISVNLSARQLQDPGLLATVREAIVAAGIAPSAVELEITESVLMRDADHSLATLTRLRDLGVGLSIDDFGTGYSSLGYLRRFPVTALKIDQSFIDGLGGGDVHADSIVEAITGLARALDLDVVAEGVETTEQMRQLFRLDATPAQGYLWAKPLPADEVPDWLAGHPRTGM
ncbi:diguanylate cyclase (GGDEF)-like protein/PAS domain S-box-containing protein [Arthrobacter sp. UYEF20]